MDTEPLRAPYSVCFTWWNEDRASSVAGTQALEGIRYVAPHFMGLGRRVASVTYNFQAWVHFCHLEKGLVPCHLPLKPLRGGQVGLPRWAHQVHRAEEPHTCLPSSSREQLGPPSTLLPS